MTNQWQLQSWMIKESMMEMEMGGTCTDCDFVGMVVEAEKSPLTRERKREVIQTAGTK